MVSLKRRRREGEGVALGAEVVGDAGVRGWHELVGGCDRGRGMGAPREGWPGVERAGLRRMVERSGLDAPGSG